MDYHDLFRFTLDSIMINLSSDNIHNHAGFVKEHRILYKGILKKNDLYIKPKKIDIHMINSLSLQSICYIAEEIHIYLYAIESIATKYLVKRLEKVASGYDLNLLDQQTDTINILTKDKEILDKAHVLLMDKIKVLNKNIEELTNTNEELFIKFNNVNTSLDNENKKNTKLEEDIKALSDTLRDTKEQVKILELDNKNIEMEINNDKLANYKLETELNKVMTDLVNANEELILLTEKNTKLKECINSIIESKL